MIVLRVLYNIDDQIQGLNNTKRSQYSVATKCFNGHEKGSWIIVDIKAEIKDEKSVLFLNEWENEI